MLVFCLQAQTAMQTGKVIRATTRMAQINVIVQAHNSPVIDLKKEDFTIYDNGKEQAIATFSRESSQSAAPTANQSVLPSDVFTNRIEFRRTTPNAITVILLDGLNSRPEDQLYAKQEVIKFLATLQPGDRVALYALGKELRILHDLTNDTASLLRVLARHHNYPGTEVAASEYEGADTGNADLDQWLNEGSQQLADFQTINRVRITQAALEAIANHVSRLSGRKNLIWISGGFPFSIGMDGFTVSRTQEHGTFSEELERAARAVNDANVAIYPINLRGLPGTDDYSVRAKTPDKNALPTGLTGEGAQQQQAQNAMDLIAQRTGGRAYYNSNDIQKAIRNAIDEANVTYVLGYYPTHETWDGKFHEVKVEVKRRGVDVRYRRGYFAFSDQQIGQAAREGALREAAWSALDATAIGMTVRASRDVPQLGKLHLMISLNAGDITFSQKDGRWAFSVDFLFVKQPAADRPTSTVDVPLAMQLLEPQYQEALKQGLLFSKDLNLAEAAYQLRVAVRDASTGHVGSVTIRVDKIAPGPAQKK